MYPGRGQDYKIKVEKGRKKKLRKLKSEEIIK